MADPWIPGDGCGCQEVHGIGMATKKKYSGLIWYDRLTGTIYQRRRKKNGKLYWKKFRHIFA